MDLFIDTPESAKLGDLSCSTGSLRIFKHGGKPCVNQKQYGLAEIGWVELFGFQKGLPFRVCFARVSEAPRFNAKGLKTGCWDQDFLWYSSAYRNVGKGP
jgi:hypothetical protein